MMKQYDLKGLIRVFQITSKKDLVHYCKSLVIHQADFVNIIRAAETGSLPYLHQIYYRDFQDELLQPKEKDIEAISANGIGPLKGHALKAFIKLQQLRKTRRYLVGHIFYTPDQQFWHFFYFDQRDTSHNYNRWKGGAHVHLINHLFQNRSAASVWSEFTNGNPNIRGGLHVRFVKDRHTVSNTSEM